MEPTVKPGYRTTEFWLTLVGQLVAVAVLFGFVPKDDQKTVYDTLAHAIQNAAALAAFAAMAWKYIKSRSDVKYAASVAKAADQQVLAADMHMRAATTQAETHSRSTNRPMGSIAILFVALSFCCSQVFATDYIFLQQGNKHFLVNQSDPTQPNKLVTIQIIPVGGGVVVPDPVVPPPGPAVGLEATAAKLTKETIQAGGTATTAAAISSVYSIVSESVTKGDAKPENALTGANYLIDGLLVTQADGEKWAAFRAGISDEFDTLREDKLFKTKEQVVKALSDLCAGMNSVIKFNGSLTKPVQQIDANAGILDKIDIERLMEIIKFIWDMWLKFKGGLSYLLPSVMSVLA